MINEQEESVLGVLMYLLHRHMEQDAQIHLDDMKLVDELRLAGFRAYNIGKAFHWLHHLVQFTEEKTAPSQNSFRVFNEEEMQLMDVECRNFILSLEQQGVLTPKMREIVIHQTLELIHEGVDLSLLKWVTLMVLFNMPNHEAALSHMEYLVLAQAFGMVH